MAERIKIGLIYEYNENWIGGTYYTENIIHALNSLIDSVKPEIYIFTPDDKSYERLVATIPYPYIKRGQYPYFNVFEKIVNKIVRSVAGRNLLNKNLSELKFIGLNPPQFFLDCQVYWIPDFQDLYFPEFFSFEEKKYRLNTHLNLQKFKRRVIFSSQSSKRDFLKHYPAAKSKIYVLPFAVTHPEFQSLDIENIRSLYQLPERYFFCPNQFWIHKNHILILKAIKILKEKGINVFVAFSGKEYEYRAPDHFNFLLRYVEENNLSDNVKFLGFIDRRHQLRLMKDSLSIIQPSLFEGWSTVVEDAKAINQFIIASDIDVHREQLKDNCDFFNPIDEHSLVKSIELVLNKNSENNFVNYEQQVNQFGLNFLSMIEDISGRKF